MFWLLMMVMFISCDLSPVAGDSYMMAEQDLLCVLSPPERRTKREVVGNVFGAWLAAIGFCVGTGFFGCVPAVGAAAGYTGSHLFHALLLYKNQVFEWGFDGFYHNDKPRATTCTATIINQTYPTNVSISEVINFGKHYEMEKGGYNFVQHNCQDFRNSLMSFLDLDWGEEDNPRTGVYTGSHNCINVGSDSVWFADTRVPFLLINGTVISISDSVLNLRTISFNASSSPWKLSCEPRLDSTLPAMLTDKNVDDIIGYTRNYSDRHHAMLTSRDLFLESLLLYLVPKDYNETLYEVGVQHMNCIKGRNMSSSDPSYSVVLRYRGLIFQWDEEGFYLSTGSRHPNCRIEWNLARIPSVNSWITTEPGISNCSLQDVVSFGQLNGFFKGEYGYNNRGYQFINNLINLLSSNCQGLSFGCNTPFTTRCNTESIRAFERMYKTFRGSRGWFFNTCSTYRGYFDRYISGYCNLVELD